VGSNGGGVGGNEFTDAHVTDIKKPSAVHGVIRKSV